MKFNDKLHSLIRLVSISFPGRDLSLAPVSIKSYILKDANISKKFSIKISQYDIGASNDDILQDLSSNEEQIYGFTSYVWNFDKILTLTKRLKDANPRSIIVLGGFLRFREEVICSVIR